MAAETHMETETIQNESEKPKKKVKQTVLDNFTKITHPNEKLRVKSGVNLLNHLSESAQNEKNENEVKYALGRIIRGLGSSTNQARTGFYTALTGLLSIKEEICVTEVFENVDKHLHKAGNNTKGENADICSGQVLVCGAIIRSGLYARSNVDEQKKVIETLLTAGKERAYLILVSYIFLSQLVDESSDKDVQKVILPQIKVDLVKPITEYTLDTLFLLLSIKKSKPDIVTTKFLQNTIGSSAVVCSQNLSQLSNIVTAIPRVTSLTHPLFALLADELLRTEHLVDFFNELNQHLHRPNRNKHLAITQLFNFILMNITDYDKMPYMLTDNFVKQTINYFKSFTKNQKDQEFQVKMHSFFDQLIGTLKKDKVGSGVKINVLKRFLFSPGTFIFEKITKSKIIQNITHTLDGEGVKELADVYCSVVNGKLRIDTNEGWVNNDRLYAAHLMVKLLHLPVVQGENAWKAEKLGFLMDLGLFQHDGLSNVGVELASTLKDAFYSALDLKSCKLVDIQVILGLLIQRVDGRLNEDNLGTVLRSPISLEHYQMWQRAVQMITKIERKKKRSHGVKSVFLTLFLHMALQLLNDPKLATDTLTELFSCYDRVRKNRHNSLNETDLEGIEGDLKEDDPLWIEVVVDLFLNLLSHNSHLLRSLVGMVFPHLCSYLNGSAVHQILNVLDPGNEDNPLSKGEEEEDSSSSDEDTSEDDEEDEEDELDPEDDDEDGDEAKVSDKLRMALHKVLSKDDDQESIDLDDLSDSEGQKLDEALAEAFKQFRPNRGKSKKQNKDEETLTHFRIRALDLIEIYLDSTPDMLLTLEIMLPLLQAVEFSIREEHQKPLHNRLKTILKKLTRSKKFSSTEGVNDAILNELLKSLLEKGTKNSLIIQEMGEEISECCIFIIKCSQTIITAEETPKKVKKHLKKNIAEIINEALINFLSKRDNLTPYVLFKNAINLSWDGNLTLATTLLQLIYSDTLKQFKKAQALELLKLFFTNQRFLSLNPEKCQEKLTEDVQNFLENTIKFFQDITENSDKTRVTERYLTILFSVINSIKSSPLKFEQIEWKTIGDTVREYRSYVSFSKDAKTAFNKLCNSLGVPHVVKMKPNVTKLQQTNGDADQPTKEPTTKKERKKRKADKEKLKLKKEAKTLRLQSLSEGLVETIDVIDKLTVKNNSDDDVEEVQESKKRKNTNDKKKIKKIKTNV